MDKMLTFFSVLSDTATPLLQSKKSVHADNNFKKIFFYT